MRHWRCFFSSAFLVDLVIWNCPFLLFVNVLLSNAQFCRTHVDISAWQDQSSCVYAWFNTLAVSLPSGSSHFVTVCICKCQEIWGILPNISSYVELFSQTSSPWSWGFWTKFPARLLRGMQTCPKNFDCSATFILKNHIYIEKSEKEVHIYTGFLGSNIPLSKHPWIENPSTQQGRRAHFSSQLFVGWGLSRIWWLTIYSNFLNGWLAEFVFLPNQWSNGRRNSHISLQ